MLYKDEAPLLSPNTAVDEGLGVETSIGSKVMGSWNETYMAQVAGDAVSVAIFIAPYPIEVVGFSSAFTTASTSGTVTVEKLTGTTAPGSGTALLTGTVSLAGTANTVLKGTLITTPGSLQLAAGDRLGLKFAGTVTNLIGNVNAVQLKRI